MALLLAGKGGAVDFYIDNFSIKDENGTEIYRIPIPLGQSSSAEKSEPAIILEEVKKRIADAYK